MNRPILAAYDPKSKDPGPARFALAAGRFSGAPVIVVSVCSTSVIAAYPMPAEEDLLPHAEQELEALGTELNTGDVAVEYRTVQGPSVSVGPQPGGRARGRVAAGRRLDGPRTGRPCVPGIDG